jgi:hypothetical protein
MPIYNIKTHVRGTDYEKPHYYILNKGLNSGKPNKEPYTNSFVVLCNSEQELEDLFWISYSLWKCKFWHQFLIGSVIPFIRIGDFKKELTYRVNSIEKNKVKLNENTKIMKLLIEKESELNNKLLKINKIREAMIYNILSS